MGEEIVPDSVVARLGNQRPRVEDALVKVPPIEDWIVVPRYIERCAKAINNRVDYLLRDSHRRSESSERATCPSQLTA